MGEDASGSDDAAGGATPHWSGSPAADDSGPSGDDANPGDPITGGWANGSAAAGDSALGVLSRGVGGDATPDGPGSPAADGGCAGSGGALEGGGSFAGAGSGVGGGGWPMMAATATSRV